MANGIDLRVKETQVEVESLIQSLKGVSTEIINISNASKTIAQNLKNVRKPSDLVQSNAEVEKQLASLQKKLEAHEKTIQALKEKRQKSDEEIAKREADREAKRLAQIEKNAQREIKARESQVKKESDLRESLAKQRKKEEAEQERAFKNEEIRLNRTTGLYNNVQQRINELSREYNNLSVKRELGRKLTVDEEMQLGKLEGRINTYQNALKKVDGNIGKFQRNVGNYASGWNGLGNSINQLTREAPAFANSLQTGFMALSNNLPTLFDEISRVKEGIKQMNAEGKETPSLFQQLAKSIFSFQTLLSIGVTLLTLYGAELVKWVGTLWDVDKALESTAKRQEYLSTVIANGRKENRAELEGLKTKVAIINDVNKSDELRLSTARKLIEQYPSIFKNMTAEQLLLGKNADLYNGLQDAILAKIDAQEKEKNIVDLSKEKYAIDQKILATEKERIKAQGMLDAQKSSTQQQGYYEAVAQAQSRLNSITEKENALKIDSGKIQIKINDLRTEQIINEEKALLLEKENTKAIQENTQAKRENVEAIDLQSNGTDSLLDKLEAQKKMFEELRQATSVNSKEYKYWTELIKGSQTSIDLITDPSKAIKAGEGWDKSLKQMVNANEALKKSVQDSEKTIDSYLGKFKDDFISQSGFTSIFDILQNKVEGFGTNWKTTFVAIAEVAQDAYNFVNQNAQANFDVQKQNADLLRDNALAYAETEEQKMAINRQYNEELRRIKNEEAQQAKRQAIFNVIINTAQAVVSALSRNPDPTGISQITVASVIGAIGAAQIAMIASQEVPKYKNGVTNAPGGLAIVGDGGVSEFIRTPDGKIMKTPNKDTLVNLPKGTDVFKNEKDFILNNPQIANFEQKDNSMSIIRGIDGAMGKYFAKIQVNQTTIDRNGIIQWAVSQGNRSIEISNRFSSKGFQV